MGPAGRGPAGVPRFVLAPKPGPVLDILSGTLALAETGDTLSATATVLVVGTLTVNQANETLSAAGGATVAGNLAATEQPDTLAATGGPVVAGMLGLTEAADTLAATGTVTSAGVTASLSLTQADNALDGEAYAGGELQAAGGAGFVHTFTRRRWRELQSLIAAEKAARAKAEQLPTRAAREPLLRVAEAAAEAIDVARIEGENDRLDALLIRNARIIRQTLHASTQVKVLKQAAAAITASQKIVDRRDKPTPMDDDDEVKLMLHLNNLH